MSKYLLPIASMGALSVVVAFAASATNDRAFDDASKERLYGEKERLSLAAIDVVTATCPDAVQSSVLAHLSIADSRQTQELQSKYNGRFSEESSSFKYYERGGASLHQSRTVGSTAQLETAIEIENLLAAENIILTSSDKMDSDMRATFYVHEDGSRELSIVRADQDWFWGGLEAQEWGEIRDMIRAGAFEEAGTYALYQDPYIYKEDNILALQSVQPDQESVTTRLGKDITPFAPQCLSR